MKANRGELWSLATCTTQYCAGLYAFCDLRSGRHSDKPKSPHQLLVSPKSPLMETSPRPAYENYSKHMGPFDWATRKLWCAWRSLHGGHTGRLDWTARVKWPKVCVINPERLQATTGLNPLPAQMKTVRLDFPPCGLV